MCALVPLRILPKTVGPSCPFPLPLRCQKRIIENEERSGGLAALRRHKRASSRCLWRGSYGTMLRSPNSLCLLSLSLTLFLFPTFFVSPILFYSFPHWTEIVEMVEMALSQKATEKASIFQRMGRERRKTYGWREEASRSKEEHWIKGFRQFYPRPTEYSMFAADLDLE